MNGSVGRAAIVYVGVVFAAGFVFGTIRVFLTAPLLGELSAVLLELPIMLFVSWLACGRSARVFGVRRRRGALVMGAAAFALLMIAELALSVLAFGRSPAESLGAFGTPAGIVGLTGQVVFGLMPLFRSLGSPAAQQ